MDAFLTDIGKEALAGIIFWGIGILAMWLGKTLFFGKKKRRK